MKKEIYIWDKIAKSFHVTSLHSRAHRDKYLDVVKIILDQKPKNILDLGSGSGILEKELIERRFKGKIVAVDASSAMVGIAKEYVNSDNVEFIKADLDDKIPSSEKFDIIVSINLLFFLDNKEKFLKNVSERLRNKDSLFILISPKPNDETSNIEFIKEHFKDTSFGEKILIFISEIFNIPYYIKMAFEQNELSKMAKSGKIIYHKPDKIKEMAENAKMHIIDVKDIHAKQNWLIMMRRD